MAISGTYDYNLTANEIIQMALQHIGATGEDETPTPAQFASGRKWLNVITKRWRSNGLFIWSTDWITIPLVASTIVLGTDGNDYQCIKNVIAAAENRPITGGQYSSFYKPLTTNVGIPWVSGASHTSIANLTLQTNIIDVKEGRLRDIANQTTIPLSKYSEHDYFIESNPQSGGQPSKFYFNRKPVSEIFLSPYPDNATSYVLEFLVDKYQENFDSGGNNPFFSSEWLDALILWLALKFAFQNGVVGDRYIALKADAKEAYEDAKALDHQTGGFFVAPELRR